MQFVFLSSRTSGLYLNFSAQCWLGSETADESGDKPMETVCACLINGDACERLGMSDDDRCEYGYSDSYEAE